MACFNYHLLLTLILNSIGLRAWEFSHIRLPTLLSRWFFTSPVWLDELLRFLERNQVFLSHARVTSPKNSIDKWLFQWDASIFLRGKWLEITIPMHFKLVVWGSKRNQFPFAEKKSAIFPMGSKIPPDLGIQAASTLSESACVGPTGRCLKKRLP